MKHSFGGRSKHVNSPLTTPLKVNMLNSRNVPISLQNSITTFHDNGSFAVCHIGLSFSICVKPESS